MSQEMPSLAKQAFDAGLELYLLQDAYFSAHGKDDENVKAIKFAFEFFKLSAYLGNFSGKILVNCMAKLYCKFSLEFTIEGLELSQAELEEVKARANALTATAEDKRNFWLCCCHRLIEDADVKNPCILGDLESAARQGDLLALFDWLADYCRNINLMVEIAVDMGYLALLKAFINDKDTGEKCQQKVTALQNRKARLVSEAPAVLEKMREAAKNENVFLEMMMCSPALPTELIEIIHDKLSKNFVPPLVAASMGSLLASARQNLPSLLSENRTQKDKAGYRLR